MIPPAKKHPNLAKAATTKLAASSRSLSRSARPPPESDGPELSEHSSSVAHFSPPSRDMTIGNVLVRNHQVLAKACLGGGFAYGFLYTNSTGSSPIRDAAQATGASDHPPASRSLRVSSFPAAYRLFKPSRAPTLALSGRA